MSLQDGNGSAKIPIPLAGVCITLALSTRSAAGRQPGALRDMRAGEHGSISEIPVYLSYAPDSFIGLLTYRVARLQTWCERQVLAKRPCPSARCPRGGPL